MEERAIEFCDDQFYEWVLWMCEEIYVVCINLITTMSSGKVLVVICFILIHKINFKKIS